jgi:kynurenine formamidase
MCLPACTAQLAAAVSRRAFLRRTATAIGAVALPSLLPGAEPVLPRVSFQRVIDLTHTLGPAFPLYRPEFFTLEQARRRGPDQYNAYRWHLYEHIGTHLDAPLHFSDGLSADLIPAERLVGPLVIVDIRARAAADPNAALTPADLRAWEDRHGRIPEGAIVALYSGWDAFVGDAQRFLGRGNPDGRIHMPGFHVETVQFLQEERSVHGIVTDTYNLDISQVHGFPAHHYWLGHGKWGVENVANLGLLPPSGATVVVGGPKIAGCTGGPSRVLALL